MTRRSARVCGVATMIAMLVICATRAMSQGNSVVVESKSVLPGQTGVSVGVYISNAVALTSIALPLEFRTVGADNIPHAFTLGPVNFDWNPAGRCYSSVFGPNSPTGVPGQVVKRWYPVRGGTECSGPTSGTYEVASGLHDDHSPDGNLFTAVGVGCDNCGDDIDLDPGMETPGVDAPSLLIQFGVNSVQGQFEIDTCCVRPANHLYFIDRNTAIVPGVEFTKGVITVGTPPDNSVVVESKTVIPGQTDVQVGVYVSNSVDILGIVLPLEFRTISGGAFYTDQMTRQVNSLGRVFRSPLGPQPVIGPPGIVINTQYPVPGGQSCSGPISNTYATVSQMLDPVSPDGFLLACVSQDGPIDDPDEIALPPGTETPGADEPSFFFRFNVTAAEGRFEIDTCCIRPANHLSFVDINVALIVPEFSKGIITVGTPPENSVVVESKKVLPGATNVEVGVFVSNTVPLYALLIPLEFRTVSGGAFTSGQTLGLFSQSGRISQLYCTLGGCPGEPCEGTLLRRYASPTSQSCSGPLSSSYSLPSASLDGLSPDGFLFGVIGCDTGWLPQEQEIPGEDVASFQFRFDVAAQAGEFEIDTCCVMPANHLFFQEHYLSAPFTPWFTKGRIHVGCFCECHGDPDCNGYLDIVDVVRTINTSFRGLASITDQDCTHARTDVDANAMTNVLDVARMIDVVFGGESQQDVFVDPCAN